MYPSYKQAETAWYGWVPTHWNEVKAKHILTYKKELNIGMQRDNVLSLTLRGVVNNNPENPEGLVPNSYETYQLFNQNDLVFKLIDLENLSTSRVGIVHEDGIMSSAYLRFIASKPSTNPRYFYYLYYNLYKQNIFNQLGSGVRSTLGQDDMRNMQILVPPIDEQNAIVAFLGEQTAVINQFLTNKRRLIALLEEQKQVVINTAVTQGLDPNAPRHPSSIDWLGDIPAHWEFKRLKFLTTFVTSGSRGWAQYYSDEGALFIRVGNLSAYKGIYIDLSDMQCVTPPQGSEGERTRIQQNDVLIAITGATIGSVGVVCEDLGRAYVNQHVALARPRNELIESQWLGYCIFSTVIQKQIDQLTTGGTKEGLGLNDVRNFMIPIPPLPEQKQIVIGIEQKTAEINAAIERTQHEIELIEEYRTTLIAHAVTGKIRPVHCTR